jgi:anti-repressor protein
MRVKSLRFQTETQPAVSASLAVIAASSSDAGLTMSTVEIAELTGKRHDNVLRDAYVMLAELKKPRLKFEASFLAGNGRWEPCLNLPKLERLTLVTGYSVELRYRVVGR